MPSTFLHRSRGFAAKHALTVTGEGNAIVLGNGFGARQACWGALLPMLEAGHRVVRFDWAVDAQHFDTTRYSALDGYVDDLLAIVRAGAQEPCTLIGHSMSSMISMLAAKREPGLFRHIVMIAPAPCFIRDAGYDAGFTQSEIDALLEAISDDYLAWTAAFAPIAVGAHAEAIDDFREELRALRPDIALTMAQLLFSMDLRPELADYRTPTTIIQPTADPVVPVAVGQYLAAQWPQAELVVIDSAGHLPHVTAPDKVAAVLARVL